MTKPITRRQWRAHKRQHEKALRNEYPMWTPSQIEHRARRATVALHGPEPEGDVMSKSLKTFVNRWGVVISVIYVALTGLLKILAESGVEWASSVAIALAAIFGLLGLSPLEPTLAGAVMTGVASAWALYGASRKVASQVRKARAASTA